MNELGKAFAKGLQEFLSGLGEAFAKGLQTQILFLYSWDNVYLNGKKLFFLYKSEFINKDSKNKNENNYLLNPNNLLEEDIIDFIYKNFGNSLPEDAEFIFFDDDKMSLNYPVLIFSKSLFLKNICEKKDICLSNFKCIKKRENNSFDIYEYPQYKNEKEYYSIILFGTKENNELLTNIFLNFLLEVKKEDNYRFKLEDNKNEKNYCINTSYIKSDKGNFKFNYINYDNNDFQIDDFLKLLNSNNNIFVINYMNDKNIISLLLNYIEISKDNENLKIYSKIYENELKENFIINSKIKEKIITFIHHIQMFELYGENNKNFLNFLEFIKVFGNILEIFPYFSDAIQEKKDNQKIYDYLYLCLVEEMSFFYESVIKNTKFMELSLSKKIFEKFKPLIETIKKLKPIELSKNQKLNILNLQNEKLNDLIKKYQLEKLEYERDLNQNETKRNKIIENELTILNNEIIKNDNYYNNEILNIKMYEKNIKKNNNFLIPLNPKNLDEKKLNRTNICKICKYNCHKNCNHIFKRMCICFDWSFNCKNCPNKCSADKHKIIDYEYPDYNYDTIFNIIKKYDNNYENSMEFKSTLPYEYLLDKMQEKQNEIKNKLEMKLVKIKNINSICLIDNNNDDIEKLFEDKKIFIQN